MKEMKSLEDSLEFRIPTEEVDKILLENQLLKNNLRSHNWFVKLLKKIFRGNQ